MATEVYEDGLDLYIDLLEAGTPASGQSLPPLRRTGQSEMRTFRTVVLENGYLKVQIVPALGGRIVSLFDKRTQTEILQRHKALQAVEGGPRGVFVREGIQWVLDGHERPNALGNVAVQIEHSPDEEAPAGVWIHESGFGPLGFHLRVALPPDRAEVLLEVRVANRTLTPTAYAGGLRLYVGTGFLLGPGRWTDPSTGRAIGIFPEETLFALETYSEGVWTLWRTPPTVYEGRQTDTFSTRLVPFSGVSAARAITPDACLSLEPERIVVQSARRLEGAKVVLGMPDGSALEAPVELYAEHAASLPLDGLAPEQAALLDAGRTEMARGRWDAAPSHTPAPWPLPTVVPSYALPDDEASLALLSHDLGRRHLGALGRAILALREGDPERANRRLEEVLNTNAEDPLTWALKVAAQRHAGAIEPDAEVPELLNAHFLAPLEPMLRAEAFLGQTAEMGKEPSPLVAPLAETPEAFVEVAALLIEAGLFMDAQRWLDEALRHCDLAMLRYLLADLYLSQSRLEAEAAEQVRAAERLGQDAPYPWRKIERAALERLTARFPEAARLKRLAYASS